MTGIGIALAAIALLAAVAVAGLVKDAKDRQNDEADDDSGGGGGGRIDTQAARDDGGTVPDGDDPETAGGDGDAKMDSG